MTTEKKKVTKPIPEWAFVAGLILCVVGLGAYQITRETPPRADPVISEFLALNQTGIRDGTDELSDWIEIWNPTDKPIELEGYSLTDDYRVLQKWLFPKRTLAPGDFLVVYASGKDIAGEYGELHTNFRLAPEGEYLALVATNGLRIAYAFMPKYPKQYGDTAYGIAPDVFQQSRAPIQGKLKKLKLLLTPSPGKPRESHLLEPTPGTANKMEMIGRVAETKFSLKRGFLNTSANIALSVKTQDADIRFTRDGSTPNETNGVGYTEPIKIIQTTVLRAAAFRPEYRSGKVSSHTYIFPKEVIKGIAGNLKMEDKENERALSGLREISSVSLILPDPDSKEQLGLESAIPASMEFMDAGNNKSKQINCGVQLAGPGSGDIKENKKPGFRLIFNSEFGDTEFKYQLYGKQKPKTFHGLRLISGNHLSATNQNLAMLISDTWIRATMQELGHPAARSRFVHLYLNGNYEGVYSLMELPEAGYLSTIRGTQEPKYEIRQGLEQIAGDPVAWNDLMAGANSREATPSNYEFLNRKIKMDAFIDFILIQLFSGVSDLDRDGNWMAVRSRSNGGKLFEFLTTESHEPMSDWFVDQINFDANSSPARLFQVLRRDQQFRAQFAGRASELLGDGGALSSVKALERYHEMVETIKGASVLETLRWKDNGTDGLEEFLEKRPGEFRKQLESAGLWE